MQLRLSLSIQDSFVPKGTSTAVIISYCLQQAVQFLTLHLKTEISSRTNDASITTSSPSHPTNYWGEWLFIFSFLHKSNQWLFTFFWFGLVFMWHIKVVLDMSNFRKSKNLKDLQHWRAELQAKLQSLCALWITHQFQAPAKSQTYWFPFEKLTEQVQHTLCAKSVSLFANLKTHKTSSSLWGWKSSWIMNLPRHRCLFCD